MLGTHGLAASSARLSVINLLVELWNRSSHTLDVDAAIMTMMRMRTRMMMVQMKMKIGSFCWPVMCEVGRPEYVARSVWLKFPR